MARRRRRDEEDGRDDRRDRRAGASRGRSGGGGSGTTVVVIAGVGCVLFLIGIFAFVNSKKGKKPKRKRSSSRKASQKDITEVSRGDTTGDDGGGAATSGVKRAKLVSASCTGRWRVYDPGPGKSNPDPRRIELKCPSCGKSVSLGTATCSCGQPLEWPKSIPCGFCNGDGLCKICKDKEHLCPWCVDHPRGGMFGMDMGNCPMGCSNGKCPGCKGSGGCGICKGKGKIVLEEAQSRGQIK